MTTAPIGSLAWEPPYAVGGTLKAKKAKNKNNDKKQTNKKTPEKQNTQRVYCQAEGKDYQTERGVFRWMDNTGNGDSG